MNHLRFLKYFTTHCVAVILFSICQSSGADFPKAEAKAKEHGQSAIKSSAATINQGDLKNFLERLASEEYEGRGTGDKGEMPLHFTPSIQSHSDTKFILIPV